MLKIHVTLGVTGIELSSLLKYNIIEIGCRGMSESYVEEHLKICLTKCKNKLKQVWRLFYEAGNEDFLSDKY